MQSSPSSVLLQEDVRVEATLKPRSCKRLAAWVQTGSMIFTGLPWAAGIEFSEGVYLDWTPGTGWSGGTYGTEAVNYGLGAYAGVGLECGLIRDGSRFSGVSAPATPS